jgi:hypothetical protein
VGKVFLVCAALAAIFVYNAVADSQAARRKAQAEQAAQVAQAEQVKKEACMGDFYEWKKKPWPFEGYYCNKPAPYDCKSGETSVAAAHEVWKGEFKTYWDKQTTAKWPDEVEKAKLYENSAHTQMQKAAREYLAHPECKMSDADMELTRKLAE